MQAIVCEERGGRNGLRLREVPGPQPAPGHALLRVEAAGVNYADVMMRRGLYPGSPEPPFIPGFEVCGTVEDPGSSSLKSGDRVLGLVNVADGGGYAQKVRVSVASLLPLPAGLSPADGAAFPVVFLTAYGVLRLCGRVQPGETVLIHAAGGGVGTAAVQMAHAWGARVIATAGSDEKLERVRALGADVVVNYRTQDFGAAVLAATGGRGADVVLESVGGAVFRRSLEVLAPLGRLVVFGIASAEPNSVEAASLLFHSRGVIGFHMSALVGDPVRLREAMDELGRLLANGQIRPVIGHRLPLAQAAEAHRLLEERESFGKILLIPADARA